ncbi:cytochrome P450 [Fomitopsis serialis]|uniref:cytochrome P450 n=1 Tax=Fomitopsis serialis TaxID=139415 RepID=UPI002007792A|nr:cytochrome P450 [Neoantrodia serialis]KAH9917065.1 cytochrome P450 [Neoantrodia serialis]
MGLPPSPAMLLLAVIAIGLAYKFRAARSRSHTLPPGPKPWPLLGNALQVSLEYMHHTFSEWRQRYGTSVPTTINVPRARGDSSPVEDLPGWLKNALPASLSRVRQTQNERLRRMAKEEWKASPRAERMDRIDPEMPSKKYGKLAEKLPRRQASDVVYFSVLGRGAIVLNSLAAQDLLDKRNAIYSDRPRSILIHEMMDFSPNMPLLPYNDEWRRQRRWIQASLLDKAKLDSYRPIQQREVVRMLAGILKTPDAFASLIRRYEGGIMLEIAYGRTITAHDDSFVKLACQAILRLTEAGSPSASLVDFVPILRYMPTWLPGSAWKRKALDVRRLMQDVMHIPYEHTKQALAAGTAGPSFLTTLLEETSEKGSLSPEDERAMKGIASVLYAAGTDTSATVVVTFVLAMVLHPDVCRKAQMEIDQVVGNARLPNFQDRDSLPYVECILRETFRWNAPLPIGKHSTSITSDDLYRDFHIPRNTIVIANLWHMARDPEVYPAPEVFLPERYLGMDASTLDATDPRKSYSGSAGGELCPGRQLADSSIWLAIACMLATLDFSKARDAAGDEITPATDFMPGAISHPKPDSGRILKYAYITTD